MTPPAAHPAARLAACTTHPLREYRALVERVALLDRGDTTLLRLTGRDRVRFLDALLTARVEAEPHPRVVAAALATRRGRLVAELRVVVRADDVLVLVVQGDAAAVVQTLRGHVIADDVDIDDVTGATVRFSVEGPDARKVIWRLFPGEAIPTEDDQVLDTRYQDTPVCVLRGGFTGERAFTVMAFDPHASRIRDYVLQAGVGMDMERLGRVAWAMRRIEAGRPWWGADVTDDFPAESRLESLVDFDKGCFLGQEPIARMHYRGHPNWRLVGLAPSRAEYAAPDETAHLLETPDAALPTMDRDPDAVARDVARLEPPTWPGTPLRPLGAGPRAADAASSGAATATGGDTHADAGAGAGAGAAHASGARARGRITSAIVSPARGGLLVLARVRHELVEAAARLEAVTEGRQVPFEFVELPLSRDAG